MARYLLLVASLLAGFVLASLGQESVRDHSRKPGKEATSPSTSARLPLSRHGHRVHLVGNVLYVMGGYSYGSADRGMRQAFAYDFDRARWRRLAEMGVGKGFFGSGVIAGRIYTVGEGVIECYDP